MRQTASLAVWAYMVLAVLAEVEASYAITDFFTKSAVVGVLAASQAVAIVIFYMDLRNEPGAVRLFALVPIMFLSALLIAMISSLG
ncbi:MAG: cytochrome C oxidase subunit IV family protein [Nitrososphaerota archaeon]|nr:cytochrome C oxidase subunit IV family protein [Nitrososphaerota archaeon]